MIQSSTFNIFFAYLLNFSIWAFYMKHLRAKDVLFPSNFTSKLTNDLRLMTYDLIRTGINNLKLTFLPIL
jgi:hypothetical protein